jgi:ATP-dependent Clp protease protease subunit
MTYQAVLEQTKKHLNVLLSAHTGRSAEEMEKATDRNTWMTADETVAFGLADEVVGRAPEAGAPSPIVRAT